MKKELGAVVWKHWGQSDPAYKTYFFFQTTFKIKYCFIVQITYYSYVFIANMFIINLLLILWAKIKISMCRFLCAINLRYILQRKLSILASSLRNKRTQENKLMNTKPIHYHNEPNFNQEFTANQSNILKGSYFLSVIARLKKYLQLYVHINIYIEMCSN